MTLIYKFNINHDPQVRGSKGSQIVPDQGLLGMNKLYEFFIYENNFYSNVGSKIPFEFKLESKLKKGAKITDVLHQGHITSPFGIVVSKKFKRLLEDYKIIPCEWYELKLKDEDGNYLAEEYYWMYPHRLVAEIDFEKTSRESNSVLSYKDEVGFVEMRRRAKSLLAEIEMKYPFNNPEKAMKLKAVHESVEPKQVFLKESGIYSQYDFFGFKYDINWYISEQLKQRLEASGLTGFDIGEITANDKVVIT